MSIYGALVDEPFRIDNVDLRVEWANTARHGLSTLKWYTHTLYTAGYTHEGRFIGHHMGGDSQDIFVKVRYHAGNSVVGFEADREWIDVHTSSARRDWAGADLRKKAGSLDILVSAGFEKIKDPGRSSSGPAAWLRLEKTF